MAEKKKCRTCNKEFEPRQIPKDSIDFCSLICAGKYYGKIQTSQRDFKQYN